MTNTSSHFCIEPLAPRRLLAAVGWDGGGNGTDWIDPLNWSTDVLPGPADDVTIDVPGTPTVRVTTTATQSIRSLNCAESLRIAGGRLDIATASQITGALTFSYGILKGPGDLSVTHSMTWDGGELVGTGATRIERGATLTVGDDVRELGRLIENDGDVFFNSANFYWGAFGHTSDAILHNLPGGTVTVAGFNTWFRNGGQPRIENEGTILIAPGGSLNAGFPFDNSGTLHVHGASAQLAFPVPQLQSNTLLGGTWIIEDAATLEFNEDPEIVTNQADVTLIGPGASFPAIDSLTTNGGRFALIGAGSFAATPVGGTFTNTGTLEIGAGSALAISGNFASTSSATLETAIGAAGDGARITATGNVALAGSLLPTLAAGYVPALDDAFDVVLATSRSGTFDDVNTLQANGVMFDIAYSSIAATLVAVADTIAPSVTAGEFEFETAPQSIRITFSEDVSASLSTSDLLLENLTTGKTIPDANIFLTYEDGTNIATFTFPGYQYGVLPNGTYRATLLAASVSDPAGNSLSANHVLNFFFMQGDADHNGVVNFDDYARIDNGFNNGLSGFSNGDFNYDGVINFDDYAIIDLAFNTQSSPLRPGKSPPGKSHA